MTASSDSVRVRFAPSPTGFLHIGGVRTALFNWLYAKHKGGKFFLRIEDTDTERSEKKFEEDILASLRWLGLDWEEPILHQSERFDLYREKALGLLKSGHAYRCYCTAAELEAMRERAMAEGKKPKYDGRCRKLPPGEAGDRPHVIRAKIPEGESTGFEDLIYGNITVQNEELDDFVIVRSNGVPTYNLVVVVDDLESRITHVIRGDDHINNTPKQVFLYGAFQAKVPLFAHLSMILGPDKKKLSKRHGDVSANLYRGEGYLPEALLNFLVRMGWSHGDQEVFSVEEMVRLFDFDHVQKGSAVFNTEKLLWLNGVHIRQATPERLVTVVAQDFGGEFPKAALERLRSPMGAQLVELHQQKVKLVSELAQQLVPLCTPGTVEVDPSGLKWNRNPDLKAPLQGAIRHAVEGLEEKMVNMAPVDRSATENRSWGNSPSLGDVGMGPTDIDAFLRQIADQHGVKLGDMAQPMRLCVTGRMVSAGLFELLSVLPWDVAGPRLAGVMGL